MDGRSPTINTNCMKQNDTTMSQFSLAINSDEGASFTPPRTPEDYVKAVKQRYGPYAEKLLEAYPPGTTTVAETARDLTRDAAFGWQTWIWARLQSKKGKSKVFYYYFDQHPGYLADSPRAGYGSTHGSEIPYVFQHLNAQAIEQDRQISEAMATYWTNFAKYGDPNGQGLPQWPAFSDANPVVMHFVNAERRDGAQRRFVEGSRCVFRLAPHAGRSGGGQVRDGIIRRRQTCSRTPGRDPRPRFRREPCVR